MIGSGPSIDLVVVNVKALGDHFVRDHGPNQPVLVLCDDGAGTRVALRRTVATQIPVGSRVKVNLAEVEPPRGPDGAALRVVEATG